MTVRAETMAAIRFGYGFHPDQTAPRGKADLQRQLEAGHTAGLLFPVAGQEERHAEMMERRRLRQAGDKDAEIEFRKTLRKRAIREGVERQFQRVLSPHGFHERLAAFWCDHFTIARRSAAHMSRIPSFEPEAIRPHMMGRFADMLIAVVRHPAMLIYLDQTNSFGPNSPSGQRRGRGLNENLAREVLELHTLGVGADYSQRDVREFAELLTGYGTHLGSTRFRFFDDRAEPGAETVLGQSYGGDDPTAADAAELLTDLARHPATARHIARKLAVHFVADAPDADLVEHIAHAWRRSEGHLPTVYDALIDHPAAWRDFGAKVKRPSDLLISALRATGVTHGMVADLDQRRGLKLLRELRDMNQPLYGAPGPDGWPEEAAAWITPQGLAARLTFASRIGQRVAKRSNIDPRAFAEATLADALRPETAFAVGAAPERWEGIALALASPEFNRR